MKNNNIFSTYYLSKNGHIIESGEYGSLIKNDSLNFQKCYQVSLIKTIKNHVKFFTWLKF